MSAEIDKISGDSYADQLSTLESRLQGHADDEAMLADLGVAMRSLLSSNGESEAHIRDLLQKQFVNGNLRRETYELVQNLLGRLVTEEAVRAPLPDSSAMADEIFAETVAEEDFATTAVIEDQAQAQVEAQALVRSRAEAEAARQVDLEPKPVMQPQLGSVLRDRFLLKEQVFEGSMGTVFKALDRRLAETGEDDTYVAIKVLNPQFCRNGAALRALQQEAAKGRCLAHPNIVRFIDLDREDTLYFIVMEWLEGSSLSRILDSKAGSSLEVAAALEILRQAGRALDYAHQRGVIHADVKPGNIIITPAGDVKLIDFGVARVKQKENESKLRADQSVSQGGTPAYSSMQVLTGEDPAPADDVFSLACLFYRLVAGYRVFGPRNAAQAAEDGMEPQRPQALSSEQWQPLKKALSYSRVTRFQSPKAFVDALTGRAGKSASIAGDSREQNEPVTEVPDIRSAQADVKPATPVPPPAPKASLEPEPVDIGEPAIERPPEPSPMVRTKAPIVKKSSTGTDISAPMRAEKESIMYEPDEDDIGSRSYFGFTMFIIFAIGAGFVAFQTGWIDRISQAIESGDVAPIVAGFEAEPEIIDAPLIDESLQDIAEFNAGESDGAEAAETADDIADQSEPVVESEIAENIPATTDVPTVSDAETVEETEVAAEPELPPVPAIDWSALPEPNAIISLAENGAGDSANISIREDAGDAIVDFVRTDTANALTIVMTETQFSGNRSPLATGRYALENAGEVSFEAGQDRVRTTISIRSNPVRETDREVELTVSVKGASETVLASLQLQLEDDDQRAFEEGLPVNTVAFAVNQISVQENDSAAQIDVLRYNADNTSLEVAYDYTDVTATAGQDYFAPDLMVVYFAPGQRTARILIPLGQDARVESDEAFMLELDTRTSSASAELFSQIAVMIRDDDT